MQILIVLSLCLLMFSLISLSAFARGSSSKDMNAEQLARRAVDVNEINNLMSLHAWYHAAFMNDLEIDEIWSKRDDIVLWFELSGVFKGREAIKQGYGGKVSRDSTKGFFAWHTITTPVVEVAEDGKTSKGIWYTPGVVGSFQNNKSNFNWMFEKYGVDFIREDGVWKIWHMHVYTDTGWSIGETISSDGSMGGVPEVLKAIGSLGAPASKDESAGDKISVSPDEENTRDANDQKYRSLSPTTEAQLRPRPPVPYRTWSETWSYVDPGE